MNLTNFKDEIDPLIEAYIQNKINAIPDDIDFAFLKKQFDYIKVFIKDGKRIRPYVTYITYLSFGGKKNKEIINNLVFIEIFHYFCLIHDDIMDNSAKRHGIKTVNSKCGVSEAILLGDYLFSWAWEIILSTKLNAGSKKNVIKIFTEMIDDVFLGQTIDIQSTHKKTVSNNLIFKKTLHKTAGYTFTKPMLIGLVLANNYSKENIKFCESLGKNLGFAFQIQDDLLDITSDFNGNKISLKDVSEGNHTVFSNYVFEKGSAEQKNILRNNFGIENIDNIKVRKVFYDSGAINYGQELMKEYFNNAKAIASSYKYFTNLIDLISSRKS
jgi:geranylgeranyl diphosphate synthase, type I